MTIMTLVVVAGVQHDRAQADAATDRITLTTNVALFEQHQAQACLHKSELKNTTTLLPAAGKALVM